MSKLLHPFHLSLPRLAGVPSAPPLHAGRTDLCGLHHEPITRLLMEGDLTRVSTGHVSMPNAALRR